MTNEETQEFLQLGRQLKAGPEAELFKRYEYLVGGLLSATYRDGIKEGIGRAIDMAQRDERGE